MSKNIKYLEESQKYFENVSCIEKANKNDLWKYQVTKARLTLRYTKKHNGFWS